MTGVEPFFTGLDLDGMLTSVYRLPEGDLTSFYGFGLDKRFWRDLRGSHLSKQPPASRLASSGLEAAGEVLNGSDRFPALEVEAN